MPLTCDGLFDCWLRTPNNYQPTKPKMKQYKSLTTGQSVVAAQVTVATFSDEHPNPNHIAGVLYDPKTQAAHLPGGDVAELGEWVVKGEKDFWCIPHATFIQSYEEKEGPPPAEAAAIPAVLQFEMDLQEVIAKNFKGMTIVEAVGVLEMAKGDIMSQFFASPPTQPN